MTLAHYAESEHIVMHTVCGDAADGSVGSSTTLRLRSTVNGRARCAMTSSAMVDPVDASAGAQHAFGMPGHTPLLAVILGLAR